MIRAALAWLVETIAHLSDPADTEYPTEDEL